MVTLFCIAVEVFVVRISILVGNFWVYFAAGICEGSEKFVTANYNQEKLHYLYYKLIQFSALISVEEWTTH